MKSGKSHLLSTLTIGSASVSMIVMSSCTGGVPRVEKLPERPNVLWIYVEDICPFIGSYGYEISRTPNIDRLAANGVLFSNAYATAPVSSAARSAVITGVMQTTTGTHSHHNARTVESAVFLPDEVVPVPQIMKEAGYYTYNNGKDDYNFIYDRSKLYNGNHSTHFYYTLMGDGHWRDPERVKDQPFFGQIQLEGGKYTLPQPARIKLYEAYLRPEERMDSMVPELPPYYPDHPVVRKEWALHFDAIKMVDYDVKRILSELEEDGLLENTIIILLSDHGSEALRNKQFLYDGGIHVPFIVSYFGNDPRIKKGLVRDDLVSGVDFGATTLALAGFPVPDYMDGMNVFDEGFKRDYVVSARDRCDFTIDRIRSVRTMQYKYIKNFFPERSYMQPQYRDRRKEFVLIKDMFEKGLLNEAQAVYWKDTKPVEELYDVISDPHEINNLAEKAEYHDKVAEFRSILETWIEETDDKGQYPDNIEALRFMYERWGERCINPEFDIVKAKPRAGTPAVSIR